MAILLRKLVADTLGSEGIVPQSESDTGTDGTIDDVVRMTTSEAGAGPSRSTSRAGFSMIEVVVSLILLAVGVLGLGGTTAHVVRQITLSDLMTERSVAFQTTIDRLQSLPYDSVDSGADSVGIFAIAWTSVPDGPQNKVVTIVTTGPGLGGTAFPTNDPAAVDTFQFRILRR